MRSAKSNDAKRLAHSRDAFRGDLLRVDPARGRRSRHRLRSGLRRARRFRRDLDDDRALAGRAASSATAGPAAQHVRTLLEAVRRARRRNRRMEGLHALRVAHGLDVRPARLARSGAGRQSISSCTTAVPPSGTSGPKSSAAIRANRASSATCRTGGSRPISSARCSTSSPTSANRIRRSCIAAGIPEKWLDGEGVAIEHLRTPFGGLSYSLARRDGRVRLEVSGDDFRMPKGGIVFMPPGVTKDANATIGGRRVRAQEGSLNIRSLPAIVEVE